MRRKRRTFLQNAAKILKSLLNKQMLKMQKMFITESQNMLTQFNSQRFDIIQKENLINKLAKLILAQEYTVLDIKHELRVMIELDPTLNKIFTYEEHKNDKKKKKK